MKLGGLPLTLNNISRPILKERWNIRPTLLTFFIQRHGLVIEYSDKVTTKLPFKNLMTKMCLFDARIWRSVCKECGHNQVRCLNLICGQWWIFDKHEQKSEILQVVLKLDFTMNEKRVIFDWQLFSTFFPCRKLFHSGFVCLSPLVNFQYDSSLT